MPTAQCPAAISYTCSGLQAPLGLLPHSFIVLSLVWKHNLTGIHRFHLQRPASTAATLYWMKHSSLLLSWQSPFEITSLTEILLLPVLPLNQVFWFKKSSLKVSKKLPFLIWCVPGRAAIQFVFQIISNRLALVKSYFCYPLWYSLCKKNMLLGRICLIYTEQSF